jgi:hypothetical protein
LKIFKIRDPKIKIKKKNNIKRKWRLVYEIKEEDLYEIPNYLTAKVEGWDGLQWVLVKKYTEAQSTEKSFVMKDY